MLRWGNTSAGVQYQNLATNDMYEGNTVDLLNRLSKVILMIVLILLKTVWLCLSTVQMA